jgi:hypothetical protein
MTVVALRPSAIGSVRDALMDLYGQHRRDGALPTSARFLFYELLTLRVLSKEKNGARRPDQILHDALTQLRESGDIPWDDIVDETRSVEDYTGCTSVLWGALTQLPDIELDPWRGRPPFILTESRSLAGVLRGIAIEFRIRICSTNGQCGSACRPQERRHERRPWPAPQARQAEAGSRPALSPARQGGGRPAALSAPSNYLRRSQRPPQAAAAGSQSPRSRTRAPA